MMTTITPSSDSSSIPGYAQIRFAEEDGEAGEDGNNTSRVEEYQSQFHTTHQLEHREKTSATAVKDVIRTEEAIPPNCCHKQVTFAADLIESCPCPSGMFSHNNTKKYRRCNYELLAEYSDPISADLTAAHDWAKEVMEFGCEIRLCFDEERGCGGGCGGGGDEKVLFSSSTWPDDEDNNKDDDNNTMTNTTLDNSSLRSDYEDDEEEFEAGWTPSSSGHSTMRNKTEDEEEEVENKRKIVPDKTQDRFSSMFYFIQGKKNHNKDNNNKDTYNKTEEAFPVVVSPASAFVVSMEEHNTPAVYHDEQDDETSSRGEIERSRTQHPNEENTESAFPPPPSQITTTRRCGAVTVAAQAPHHGLTPTRQQMRRGVGEANQEGGDDDTPEQQRNGRRSRMDSVDEEIASDTDTTEPYSVMMGVSTRPKRNTAEAPTDDETESGSSVASSVKSSLRKFGSWIRKPSVHSSRGHCATPPAVALRNSTTNTNDRDEHQPNTQPNNTMDGHPSRERIVTSLGPEGLVREDVPLIQMTHSSFVGFPTKTTRSDDANNRNSDSSPTPERVVEDPSPTSTEVVSRDGDGDTNRTNDRRNNTRDEALAADEDDSKSNVLPPMMTSARAADDADPSTAEEQRRVDEETVLQDRIVTSRKTSIIADDLISTMSAASTSKKSTKTNGARLSSAPFLLTASMQRVKKKLVSKQKKRIKYHTIDDSTNNGIMNDATSLLANLSISTRHDANEIIVQTPLSHEEAVHTVLGLCDNDDIVNPDDPAEVERRLMDRRKTIEGETTDFERQRKIKAKMQFMQPLNNASRKKKKYIIDPPKDIKFLNRLMKKNDRIKIRETRMEELDRKREAADFEQNILLQFFASKRFVSDRKFGTTAVAASLTDGSRDAIVGNESTGFEILSMPVIGGGLIEL